MRQKSLEIEELIELFKEKKIMTIEDLIRKTCRSRETIFRRFREHGYHTSYNKNGKYYTLPETADFDDEGFWKVGNVYFSKFGGVRDTVKSLVENSEKGYTAEELSIKLGTRINNHLKGFVQEGILTRKKYGDFYVYYSPHKRKEKEQVNKRDADLKMRAVEESEVDMRFWKIDDRIVIHVLLEFMDNRKATPDEIVDALGMKNIRTRKEIVEEIFHKYDLFKKKDSPYNTWKNYKQLRPTL